MRPDFGERRDLSGETPGGQTAEIEKIQMSFLVVNVFSLLTEDHLDNWTTCLHGLFGQVSPASHVNFPPKNVVITAKFRYNAAVYLHVTQGRRLMARPSGRGMGRLL